MPKRYAEIVGDGGSNILAQVEEMAGRIPPRLLRLPPIARPMARMAVSRYARERGLAMVTPEVMDDYRARMGL